MLQEVQTVHCGRGRRSKHCLFPSLVSPLLFSRCLSSKATLSSLIEWTVSVEQPEMCLAQGRKQKSDFINSPDL